MTTYVPDTSRAPLARSASVAAAAPMPPPAPPAPAPGAPRAAQAVDPRSLTPSTGSFFLRTMLGIADVLLIDDALTDGSGTTFDPGSLRDLTDGVFGFSMTVLVASLTVPGLMPDGPSGAGVTDGTSDLMRGEMLAQLPLVIAIAYSFWALATFWFTHHGMFKRVVRVDRRLLLWNLLMLFFVTLVPFASATYVVWASAPAIVMYCLVLASLGWIQHVIWRRVVAFPELRDPSMSETAMALVLRRSRYRPLGMTIVAIVAATFGMLPGAIAMLVSPSFTWVMMRTERA